MRGGMTKDVANMRMPAALATGWEVICMMTPDESVGVAPAALELVGGRR